MEKPKSKGIFWVLSIIAVIFLVLFSFSVGAGSIPMMILTFILFIATFGAGFTLKRNIVKITGFNIEKCLGSKIWKKFTFQS